MISKRHSISSEFILRPPIFRLQIYKIPPVASLVQHWFCHQLAGTTLLISWKVAEMEPMEAAEDSLVPVRSQNRLFRNFDPIPFPNSANIRRLTQLFIAILFHLFYPMAPIWQQHNMRPGKNLPVIKVAANAHGECRVDLHLRMEINRDNPLPNIPISLPWFGSGLRRSMLHATGAKSVEFDWHF